MAKENIYITRRKGRPKARFATKTSEGTVRKGTSVPYRRPPDAEIDDRVDQIAQYIRQNPIASRYAMHKEYVDKFNVGWKMIDMYIGRARILIAKESDITLKEARSIGLSTINDLLNHPDAKIRLKAEESYRAIHGYEAPRNVRIGDPNGNPMAPTVIAPTVNFVLPAKVPNNHE